MKCFFYSILLSVLILCFFSFAQSGQTAYRSGGEAFAKGELIVKFTDKQGDAQAFGAKFGPMELHPKRLLSRRMNVWLFEYNPLSVTAEQALEIVREHPSVHLAQLNHYMALRSGSSVEQIFPNDPQFASQWALHNTGQSGGTPDADIDAPEAWEIATGGTTAAGDEIVVAVIDGGADLNHVDLDFWKNIHEIPNNGIDDDNNGYTDDYDGWNAYNHSGNIGDDSHGTHVSGIAGAIGNNGTGVSGANWNVKIMPISGSSGLESIVVEAYGYVLEMRAIYNETRGDSGAFVVVTNSSFGVNYGDPNNFPIWCAMYDSLGAQGILSCGATANLNIDIDIEGDVPTACPGDWLISVTNTTRNDLKNSGAAYGLTTIDLGAPGTSILSTLPGNSYGNLTGTSMATPAVAGVVALMYSAADTSLIEAYKNDPGGVALMFKEWILQGTDSINALQGITVSGGRLNAHQSLLLLQNFTQPLIPAPPENFAAYSDYTTPSSMILTWDSPASFLNGDTLLGQDFSIVILRDSVKVDSISGMLNEYSDTGLNDGREYAYQIYAKIDNSGRVSSSVFASWIAGGSPIPNPPADFSVGGNQNQVTVFWVSPATNVDGTPMDDYAGVNLYQNGTLVTTFTRASADTGLADSDTYTVSPPGYYDWHITAVDNESPANESDPTAPLGTPLNVPLEDKFEVPGVPNPGVWITAGADVNDRADTPPSPPYALNLNGHPSGEDIVDLKPVDLSGMAGSGIALAYSYQPQGNGNPPEPEDSLRVYFKNDLGEWILVKAYEGRTIQPFTREIIDIETAPNGGGSYFHGQFQARFRSTGSAGTFPNDDWFIDDILLDTPVGIEEETALPTEYAISSNYPNPFNPATTINYQLPRLAEVSLIIYNVLGQRVRTLVNGQMPAGFYRAVWDGRNDAGVPVGSGVYIYRFEAGDYRQTQKMALLK